MGKFTPKKVPKDLVVPTYEADVHKLLDSFVLKAVPLNVPARDYLQLLYAAALNRLADPSPYLEYRPGPDERQNAAGSGRASGQHPNTNGRRGRQRTGAEPLHAATTQALAPNAAAAAETSGLAAPGAGLDVGLGGPGNLLDQELLDHLDAFIRSSSLGLGDPGLNPWSQHGIEGPAAAAPLPQQQPIYITQHQQQQHQHQHEDPAVAHLQRLLPASPRGHDTGSGPDGAAGGGGGLQPSAGACHLPSLAWGNATTTAGGLQGIAAAHGSALPPAPGTEPPALGMAPGPALGSVLVPLRRPAEEEDDYDDAGGGAGAGAVKGALVGDGSGLAVAAAGPAAGEGWSSAAPVAGHADGTLPPGCQTTADGAAAGLEATAAAWVSTAAPGLPVAASAAAEALRAGAADACSLACPPPGGTHVGNGAMPGSSLAAAWQGLAGTCEPRVLLESGAAPVGEATAVSGALEAAADPAAGPIGASSWDDGLTPAAGAGPVEGHVNDTCLAGSTPASEAGFDLLGLDMDACMGSPPQVYSPLRWLVGRSPHKASPMPSPLKRLAPRALAPLPVLPSLVSQPPAPPAAPLAPFPPLPASFQPLPSLPSLPSQPSQLQPQPAPALQPLLGAQAAQPLDPVITPLAPFPPLPASLQQQQQQPANLAQSSEHVPVLPPLSFAPAATQLPTHVEARQAPHPPPAELPPACAAVSSADPAAGTQLPAAFRGRPPNPEAVPAGEAGGTAGRVEGNGGVIAAHADRAVRCATGEGWPQGVTLQPLVQPPPGAPPNSGPGAADTNHHLTTGISQLSAQGPTALSAAPAAPAEAFDALSNLVLAQAGLMVSSAAPAAAAQPAPPLPAVPAVTTAAGLAIDAATGPLQAVPPWGPGVDAAAAGGPHMGAGLMTAPSTAQPPPRPPQPPPPVALPPPGPDVPLVGRVGAVFALYCLYGTQLCQPRVRVYVPLPLLSSLAGTVREAAEAGMDDVVAVVGELWRGGALVPGGVIRYPGVTTPRPRSMGPRRAGGGPGATTSRPGATTVSLGQLAPRHHDSFHEVLMANPALRGALLHLRTALPGLADMATFERRCLQYGRLRAAVFASTADDVGSDRGEGEGDGDGGDDSVPDALFDAQFGQEVRRTVGSLFGEVLQALRKQPSHLARSEARRKQKREQAEAEAAAAAAEAAAAGGAGSLAGGRPGGPGGPLRRRPPGELGALMARNAKRAATAEGEGGAGGRVAGLGPVAAPRGPSVVITRYRLELASAGLIRSAEEDNGPPPLGVPARVLAVEEARRQRAVDVASSWLARHDQLMRGDRRQGGAAGRRSGLGAVRAIAGGTRGTRSRRGALGAAGDGTAAAQAAGRRLPGVVQNGGGGGGGGSRAPGRAGEAGELLGDDDDDDGFDADAELMAAFDEFEATADEPGDQAAVAATAAGARGGSGRAAKPAGAGRGRGGGRGRGRGRAVSEGDGAAAGAEEAEGPEEPLRSGRGSRGGRGRTAGAGRGRGRGRGRSGGRVEALGDAGGVSSYDDDSGAVGWEPPEAGVAIKDESPGAEDEDGRDDDEQEEDEESGQRRGPSRPLHEVYPFLDVVCGSLPGRLDTRTRTVACGCEACKSAAATAADATAPGTSATSLHRPAPAGVFPVTEWPVHCGLSAGKRRWQTLVQVPAQVIGAELLAANSSHGGGAEAAAGGRPVAFRTFLQRHNLALGRPRAAPRRGTVAAAEDGHAGGKAQGNGEAARPSKRARGTNLGAARPAPGANAGPSAASVGRAGVAAQRRGAAVGHALPAGDAGGGASPGAAPSSPGYRAAASDVDEEDDDDDADFIDALGLEDAELIRQTRQAMRAMREQLAVLGTMRAAQGGASGGGTAGEGAAQRPPANGHMNRADSPAGQGHETAGVRGAAAAQRVLPQRRPRQQSDEGLHQPAGDVGGVQAKRARRQSSGAAGGAPGARQKGDPAAAGPSAGDVEAGPAATDAGNRSRKASQVAGRRDAGASTGRPTAAMRRRNGTAGMTQDGGPPATAAAAGGGGRRTAAKKQAANAAACVEAGREGDSDSEAAEQGVEANGLDKGTAAAVATAGPIPVPAPAPVTAVGPGGVGGDDDDDDLGDFDAMFAAMRSMRPEGGGQAGTA